MDRAFLFGVVYNYFWSCVGRVLERFSRDGRYSRLFALLIAVEDIHGWPLRLDFDVIDII